MAVGEREGERGKAEMFCARYAGLLCLVLSRELSMKEMRMTRAS